MLFASYRRDQFDDPDSYLTMLGTVLEQYADDVVVFVCDPRTGLQRKSKWPPTISEVVKACDERAAWLARVQRFQNWGKREAPLQLEQPREARPTREDLKAKYGPTYGIDPVGEGQRAAATPSKAPTPDQLRQHYAVHGLGFQPRAKSEGDEAGI